MVLTLVAWGSLADRFGERWVIAGGLALTALFALAAAPVPGFLGLGILLMLGVPHLPVPADEDPRRDLVGSHFVSNSVVRCGCVSCCAGCWSSASFSTSAR